MSSFGMQSQQFAANRDDQTAQHDVAAGMAIPMGVAGAAGQLYQANQDIKNDQARNRQLDMQEVESTARVKEHQARVMEMGERLKMLQSIDNIALGRETLKQQQLSTQSLEFEVEERRKKTQPTASETRESERRDALRAALSGAGAFGVVKNPQTGAYEFDPDVARQHDLDKRSVAGSGKTEQEKSFDVIKSIVSQLGKDVAGEDYSRAAATVMADFSSGRVSFDGALSRLKAISVSASADDAIMMVNEHMQSDGPEGGAVGGGYRQQPAAGQGPLQQEAQPLPRKVIDLSDEAVARLPAEQQMPARVMKSMWGALEAEINYEPPVEQENFNPRAGMPGTSKPSKDRHLTETESYAQWVVAQMRSLGVLHPAAEDSLRDWQRNPILATAAMQVADLQRSGVVDGMSEDAIAKHVMMHMSTPEGFLDVLNVANVMLGNALDSNSIIEMVTQYAAETGQSTNAMVRQEKLNDLMRGQGIAR